jgi:hypothetical protein
VRHHTRQQQLQGNRECKDVRGFVLHGT